MSGDVANINGFSSFKQFSSLTGKKPAIPYDTMHSPLGVIYRNDNLQADQIIN